MPLKSAWELALEKSGGADEQPLSDAQKGRVAKIRAEFDARRKTLRFQQEREREATAADLGRMDDREGLEKMTAVHARVLATLNEDEAAAVAKAKAGQGLSGPDATDSRSQKNSS